MENVDTRHIGMHEHGDRETAESGAPEFFREHHRAERIHFRTAVFGRIADAEKTERAHLLQDLARHIALLFPLEPVRLYFLLDEAAQLRAQLLVFFGEIDRAHGRGGFIQHRHILKTPNLVSGTGALREAASASDSTRRVSEGWMMPSSQSRAVAK